MGKNDSVLPQALVECLNRVSRGCADDRAMQNAQIRDFIRAPHVRILPMLLVNAQRICVFEGPRGRYVDIQYRDSSHHYILNLSVWPMSVTGMESLAEAIDAAGGHCQLQQPCLVLFVPAGYHLDVSVEEGLSLCSPQLEGEVLS